MYITSKLNGIPTKKTYSEKYSGVTDNGVYYNENHTSCGNVMFQIASVLGLSWDYGYTASFPIIREFYDVLKHKNFKNENIYRNLNTFDVNVEKEINLSHGYQIQKFLNEIKDKKYTNKFLSSVLKYFHKYRDRILDTFSIDESSKFYISNKYDIFDDKKM